MNVKVLSSTNSSLLFGLEEIKAKLQEMNFQYDFLLFAISPKFLPEQISSLIRKVFQTENFAAFNAIHSFCDNHIIEEGITLLAIGQTDLSFRIFQDLGDPRTKEDVARFFNQNQDAFHVIIATYNDGELGFFVEEISKKISYSPLKNIIGGIASGEFIDGELRTFLYTDHTIVKDGILVISFDYIQSALDISLGFKPYGIVHMITKAQGSKIYEVDGNIQFSQVIESFFQELSDRDIRYLWYAPLYILKEDGYVATLRTIEDVKEDYVKLFGPIQKGDQFKISFGTKEDILQEDQKIANNILHQIGIPDLVFNFSCIARQYVLEELEQEEVNIYTKILNAHLFGFFTFGEIGPDKSFHKLKLYNETSLVVGVKG